MGKDILISHRKFFDLESTGKLFIVDWDECLQCITGKWISKFYQEVANRIGTDFIIKYLNPEFTNITTKELYEKVVYRKKYFIEDNVFSVRNPPDILLKILNDVYWKDSNFYDDLPFTLLMNEVMNFAISGEKVEICSYSKGYPGQNKQEIFKREGLGELGMNLTLLNPDNTNKADYIMDKWPDYDFVIEDDFNTLLKLAEMKNPKKATSFIVPIYGYNKDKLEEENFKKLIYEKGISIMTVDSLKSLGLE